MPCAEGFENATHLPFPKSMPLASQIHEMGIKLGDNIVGREGDKEGTWWSEKRLTLLWVGQTAAVFRVATRNKSVPTWHEVGEAANWTLDSRKWFLANPENVTPASVGSSDLLSISEFATVAGGEVAPHAKSVTAGKTAQISMYANGECPHCGSPLIGDGYRDVLHCENAEPETYEYHEPDAQPVLCANPEVSHMAATPNHEK